MRIYTLAAVLSALSMSCAPEPYERPVWEEVSYQELTTQFDNPTGSLADTDQLLAIYKAIEERVLDYQVAFTLTDTMKGLLSKVEELAPTATFETKEGALNIENTSAAAWVKISCWGPDPEQRNTDFEYGTIYLDSDELSLDQDVAFNASGNFLIRFENCVLGPLTLRGEIPGYLDPQEGRVAARIDLEGEIYDEPFEFSLEVLLDNWMPQIQINLEELGTYTIFVDPSDFPNVFGIKGSAGDYGCAVEGLELQCTVPGGGLLTVTP